MNNRLRHQQTNPIPRSIGRMNGILDKSQLVLMKTSEQTGQLNNIRLAAPCNKDWDSMLGDDRVRFCNACSKNVYNISEMNSKEADAFLRNNGVSQCMRIFRRADGTVITDNCPVGLRRIRNGFRWLRRAIASTVGLCISVTAAFAQDTNDLLKLDLLKVLTSGASVNTPPVVTGVVGEMGEFKCENFVDLTIPEDKKALKAARRQIKAGRIPKDFEQAIVYQQAGELRGAIERYERVLATNNEFSDSSNTNLAACLISRDRPGDRDRARGILEKLNRSDPKNGNVYFCLGLLHEQNQELDEAARAYGAAIRLQPLNLRAVKMLCELCARSYSTDRYLTANEALRKALSCEPPHEVRALIEEALSELNKLPNKH